MELGSIVAALSAHCRAAIDGHAGPLAGLAMAGLVSGFSHCSAMCGPFVLLQAGHRLAALPLAKTAGLRRLAGVAALPYQLGRATTYVLLGGLTAGGYGGVVPTGLAPVLAPLLMLAAAILLWQRAGNRLAMPGATAWAPTLARLARRLLANPLGWTGYGLGLVLGLLPCAVLYAALLLAASTGNALTGGLGMLLFALATMPGLMLVGVVGHVAARRWSPVLRQLPAIVLLTNALALLAIGARLGSG